MSTFFIPESELPAIVAAIEEAVREYGHPENIPPGALRGVETDTADKCFALLKAERLPEDAVRATERWCRLIGEFAV
jgi:hypothetical protein